MERPQIRSRSRFLRNEANSAITWVIPKHYLSISEVEDGVNAVAAWLTAKGFTEPQTETIDAKSVITFYSGPSFSFKDVLHLASLLPIQLDEPVEMWYELKWVGAKDVEDGKFDCRVRYRLDQWMLKIRYETETTIGELNALEKKKWLIRL